MDKLALEEVIIKYINDEASANEIELLKNVIQSNEHNELLESYFLTDHFVNTELRSFDAKEAFGLFTEQTDEEETSLKISWIKRNSVFLKYVAVLAVGLFSFGYFLQFNIDENEISTEITLELEDGSTKTINVGDNQNLIDSEGVIMGVQENERLVYGNSDDASKKIDLRYNKLYVPYGKKFQISLSDGSLVYLNSGSTLRYPVKFPKNGTREVFLNGEAYFEVSKDKEHSFIVRTKEINTEVYGTEFDISSYENDDIAHVVLVEGSVGVSYNMAKEDRGQLMIKPFEKAEWDKKTNEITKASVKVESYVAWKDGVLMFDNEPFETIIRKLERHFDVSIINNVEQINHNRYTGVFDVESLEEILEAFSNHRPFEYKMEGDQIIIDPSL